MRSFILLLGLLPLLSAGPSCGPCDPAANYLSSKPFILKAEPGKLLLCSLEDSTLVPHSPAASLAAVSPPQSRAGLHRHREDVLGFLLAIKSGSSGQSRRGFGSPRGPVHLDYDGKAPRQRSLSPYRTARRVDTLRSGGDGALSPPLTGSSAPSHHLTRS